MQATLPDDPRFLRFGPKIQEGFTERVREAQKSWASIPLPISHKSSSGGAKRSRVLAYDDDPPHDSTILTQEILMQKDRDQLTIAMCFVLKGSVPIWCFLSQLVMKSREQWNNQSAWVYYQEICLEKFGAERHHTATTRTKIRHTREALIEEKKRLKQEFARMMREEDWGPGCYIHEYARIRHLIRLTRGRIPKVFPLAMGSKDEKFRAQMLRDEKLKGKGREVDNSSDSWVSQEEEDDDDSDSDDPEQTTTKRIYVKSIIRSKPSTSGAKQKPTAATAKPKGPIDLLRRVWQDVYKLAGGGGDQWKDKGPHWDPGVMTWAEFEDQGWDEGEEDEEGDGEEDGEQGGKKKKKKKNKKKKKKTKVAQEGEDGEPPIVETEHQEQEQPSYNDADSAAIAPSPPPPPLKPDKKLAKKLVRQKARAHAQAMYEEKIKKQEEQEAEEKMWAEIKDELTGGWL